MENIAAESPTGTSDTVQSPTTSEVLYSAER